jgi:hypothetical protein
MSETKTRCAECGAMILQRTASKYGGLCVPCNRRNAAKVPGDFEMPHNLLERVVKLNENPEHYREIVWRDGADLAHVLLNKVEEAADEYLRWFPRLQMFAAECRRAAPCVKLSALSDAEREQYRVLLIKMKEFEASGDSRVIMGRKPNCAAILSTTRAGLVAAQETFAESGAVVLEESEKRHWFAHVYPIEDNKRWWFVLAWWTLMEGLPEENGLWTRHEYPIVAGSSYWVVESGLRWGPQFGGLRQELWRWNGAQAEFVENVMDAMF